MQARAAQLLAALGPDIVSIGNDIPPRNLQDWSGLAPVRPLALARPRTTAEVSAVLRHCHEHGLAVVPQGGLTGLSGGGHPLENAVALSLERMVGVEEIDPDLMSMVVQAGTPLEIVQKAADEAGFLCPLDLGARGSCAIGGNLSTNAGGNSVIRYGMARDMVLGLEVVLADGTVLDNLNKLIKNNTGYDLKHLFIGSEGTLGVITRAVLKLQPRPTCGSAAFCGFDDFASVLAFLRHARASLGPGLSAFEVMWPDFYDLMVEKAPGVRAPLAGRHAFYVLIECEGSSERFDLPRFEQFLEGMIEEGVIADAAVAQSLSDARAFWDLRDSVSEFPAMLGPNFGFDVSLPMAQMDAFVQETRRQLAERFAGFNAVFFGHLGDNNLHMQWTIKGVDPLPKPEVDALVYGLVRDRKGSISAEHGIGLLRKPYLAYSKNETEIALMKTLKAALDPKGILNPGKVL